MKRSVAAFRAGDVPYLLGGSLACWARGGPPPGHDLDFVVKPEDAERALALLPEATQARLRGISPSLALGRVTTRLFVMHDLGDHFIPYTESRRMARQAPATSLARFTEFDLFDHVMPNKSLVSASFAIELAKLFRQLYEVLVLVL